MYVWPRPAAWVATHPFGKASRRLTSNDEFATAVYAPPSARRVVGDADARLSMHVSRRVMEPFANTASALSAIVNIVMPLAAGCWRLILGAAAAARVIAQPLCRYVPAAQHSSLSICRYVPAAQHSAF